jgi:DNA (cytosine-5)-methyltransferase 1
MDWVSLRHLYEAVGRSGHSKEELGYIENNMKNGQIRKLTPKECFRLQGFINDEVNLDGISDTQKYKLAGNGQSVNVVEKIFRQMFKVENYKNLVCSLEHTKD